MLDVRVETSTLDVWLTAGTILAALATAAAVIVALFVSRRENKSTLAALAISQRMMEHADEDRRQARAAMIVVDRVERRERPSDPLARIDHFLRVRNVGQGFATEVRIGKPLPGGIDVLASGQSVTLVGPTKREDAELWPGQVAVTWTARTPNSVRSCEPTRKCAGSCGP